MHLTLIAALLCVASGAEWAVIMAGSNTYANYRHQSDACHAYQIAKKNGIPQSNIILLAYDDIASSPANPFPGKIFNKPTAQGVKGTDVYAGCKIDYKGNNVNKANFIKVLSGDTNASGPVLKSTAQDRVFVYYADHGGVGILGVPSGAAGGFIHAKDVNDALETLHAKGGYKELLFYLEACESGSIFKGLLKAPNVFAVTAASPNENSFGFYCPPQDKVNGKEIHSCLGDEFSINWMEDSDKANFKRETVNQQVATVKNKTKKSHVQQYGDSSTIGGEVIGNFEGAGNSTLAALTGSEDYSDSAVNSRDVEVHLAYYEMQRAQTAKEKKAAKAALSALLARHMAADAQFLRIAMAAVGDTAKAEAMLEGPMESLGNVQCHVQAIETVQKSCGAFNDYTMRYSRLFANLCNTLSTAEVEAAVRQVCTEVAEVVV